MSTTAVYVEMSRCCPSQGFRIYTVSHLLAQKREREREKKKKRIVAVTVDLQRAYFSLAGGDAIFLGDGWGRGGVFPLPTAIVITQLL